MLVTRDLTHLRWRPTFPLLSSITVVLERDKPMIELLCTVAGILGGVAVVAAIVLSKSEHTRKPSPIPASEPPPEKMQDIADQLRMLTFRVSADVCAHTEAVGSLTEKLQFPSAQQPEKLMSTIEELVTANRKMQSQLADARKRIADQSELIEFASVQARTDALTGLANRRALDEFLGNCLSALRIGDFAGLLLLDIDHFKKFNDEYGHTTGDGVLAAFARCIKQSCGQTGFAARYGGEEFAVILTGYSMIDVVERAAKLRADVGEQVITFEDLQLNITASAGLCELKPGESIEAAYARADAGLYRAKESGRNRGYWLHIDQWHEFPSTSSLAKPQEETSRSASRVDSTESSHAYQASQDDGDDGDDDDSESSERRRLRIRDKSYQRRETYRESIERALATNANLRSTEFLDLGTFVDRLEPYLTQLRRASLPATAAMIEAVGLDELSSTQSRASWSTVLGILQSHMRGIDVACHFRQSCVCILMPGCTLDAALERCSRIQASLEQARSQWDPPEACPDRLAIAIASAQVDEEPGSFLHRLEQSLEESEDAELLEIVVHDGNTANVQRLV